MKPLTPLVKGIITGIVMAGLQLLIFYVPSLQSNGAYMVYGVYFAGIMWTLISFERATGHSAKFGEIFGQGFRCFIIATLIVVLYVGIFGALHPELAAKDSLFYKEQLIKQGNKQLPEIETLVAKYKKEYVTSTVYTTVFGSLIMGAALTLAGSAILLMRRRK